MVISVSQAPSDSGENANNLERTLERPHSRGNLDEEIETLFEEHKEAIDEYAKQIASLRDDIEVMLGFTSIVERVLLKVAEADRPKSEFSGITPIDPDLLEKYRNFLKRYERPAP